MREYAELDPVVDTRLVRVTRWCCLHDGEVFGEERCHAFTVLTLIRSGAFALRLGRRSTLLDAAGAVLHAPGVGFSVAHPLGCGDCGWHIGIENEALRQASAAEDEKDEHPMPAETHVVPLPARAFLALRLALAPGRWETFPDPMAVEEAVLRLAGAMAEALPARQQLPRRPSTEELHERCFERAREVLFTRRRESVQLDELARAVHASPFHLSRLFKRAAGVPIHRYLSRLRLLDGLEQVATREVTLTDLAYELGFSSHSHFTAAFHREFGMTPSRFRALANTRRVSRACLALGEECRVSHLAG
jgi:AraC family transcriptional regulator